MPRLTRDAISDKLKPVGVEQDTPEYLAKEHGKLPDAEQFEAKP